MQLTSENYYSVEANREYMSESQFKDFAGTYGRLGCEACAMAKIRGEYVPEVTTPLLVGSYVDSYFESTESHEKFIKDHPEIMTRNGGLKAEYQKADRMISRIEQDKFFMFCMSGSHQTIMTAEIFGIPWKIKMDSYIPGKFIVDLKTVRSLHEVFWVKDAGYMDFVRYWGYDIQGAIYQEVVYKNTGKRLPFYIAAVSKESEPDIAVIHVEQFYLNQAMETVRAGIERIKRVKSGEAKPDRCERCDYCKQTKVLSSEITIGDLLADIR